MARTATAARPRVLDETLLTLAEAAKRVPGIRPGKCAHWRTLLRWSVTGVRVGGRVIRLEAAVATRRTVTSREAVDRFLGAVDAARSAGCVGRVPEAPPVVETPAQKRRRDEAAMAELRRLGVKV